MLAPYSEAAEGGPLLDLAIRSLELFDRFVAQVERRQRDARRTTTASGTLARGAERRSRSRRSTRCIVRLPSRGVRSQSARRAAEARSHEPQLAADLFGALLIPAQGLVSALRSHVRARRRRRCGAARRVIEPAIARRISAHGDGVEIETTRGSVRRGRRRAGRGRWSGQIEIAGAAPRSGDARCAGSCCTSGGRVRRSRGSSGASAATWCRGATARCSSARRSKTPASTSGRRSRASAICWMPPATSFLTRRPPACCRRARASGRRRPIPCRSSAGPRSCRGLMYATGHYRNGVLLAPLTAKLVADAMLDGTRRSRRSSCTTPSRFGNLVVASRKSRHGLCHCRNCVSPDRPRRRRSMDCARLQGRRRRALRRGRCRADRGWRPGSPARLAGVAPRARRGARGAAAGRARVSSSRDRSRVCGDRHRRAERRREGVARCRRCAPAPCSTPCARRRPSV